VERRGIESGDGIPVSGEGAGYVAEPERNGMVAGRERGDAGGNRFRAAESESAGVGNRAAIGGRKPGGDDGGVGGGSGRKRAGGVLFREFNGSVARQRLAGGADISGFRTRLRNGLYLRGEGAGQLGKPE